MHPHFVQHFTIEVCAALLYCLFVESSQCHSENGQLVGEVSCILVTTTQNLSYALSLFSVCVCVCCIRHFMSVYDDVHA